MKPLLLLLIVLLAACSPEPEPAPVVPQPEPSLVILAVGDSLTEGYGLQQQDSYPAQLERELTARGYDVEVRNAGVSGETTAGLAARSEWLLNQPSDIVIIVAGGNDALRALPVTQTEENLRTVIESFLANNKTVVFGGMIAPDNNGQQYVDEFAAVYPRLADDYDLPFIPFFLEGVVGDIALNQPDDIHPTKEGYAIIVEQNVLPVLLPLLS